MMNIPQDPVGEGGLTGFPQDFRSGKITFLAATQTSLVHRWEALHADRAMAHTHVAD